MDTLLSTDRCDSCNAQGYVEITKYDSSLVFCAHHYAKNADSLEKSGWTITVDERSLLSGVAKVS
jgi:hypothetical protein